MERRRERRQRKVRILIIRFSSIGDIVLTTPVIRCLKEQIPNAEIHFLTKKNFKNIIENNPYIDQTHYLRKSLADTIFKIQGIRFDYIIDLHKSLRSFWFRFSLMGTSYTFDKLNVQKWMMVNFKKNNLPDLHIVDRYMETVKPLGVKYDGKGLDFFLSKADRMNVDDLPDNFKDGFASIVIGAKHNTKQIPSFILEDTIANLSIPVVLLGSKVDFPKADKIVKKFPANQVFNACGRYNLGASASFLEASKFVITPDTGLMHIAAAFGKDIISLWGNTIPAFGMTPFYADNFESREKNKIIEVTDLDCRPCSKLGFRKCPKKHFKCMRLLDAVDVLEALKNFPEHKVLIKADI
ncbi:MAG: glycosyltransferase family 9 protein [Chitinophagaceae bacterium]|nr:MAG: glycosyltransferase family 9 protein [Chitinophagaceae bacterium]